MSDQITRLTKTDLEAIEARIGHEMAALGAPPTLEEVRAEGYQENTSLNRALDWIAGAGRVVTLLTAEFVQAFAALGLALVFIILEAERINAGVIALGQHQQQAALIALAFTVGNAVLPIYRLRNARGQAQLQRTKSTVRGYLAAFWRRLVFKPTAYAVDHYDNPTLGIMEGAVTWATLFLAFYAVLGPMLARYESLPWYSAAGALVMQSSFTQMLGLLAGALLAVGGVFGVQSISHEIGVRTLTDQPPRLTDVLEARRVDYESRRADLRQRVTYEFMAAKLADDARKKAERAPQGMQAAFLAAQHPTSTSNGNGNHHAADEG